MGPPEISPVGFFERQFEDIVFYLPHLKALRTQLEQKGWNAADLATRIMEVERENLVVDRRVIAEAYARELADHDGLLHASQPQIVSCWEHLMKYMQVAHLWSTAQEVGLPMEFYEKSELVDKSAVLRKALGGETMEALTNEGKLTEESLEDASVVFGIAVGVDIEYEPEPQYVFSHFVPVAHIPREGIEIFFRADIHWNRKEAPITQALLEGKEAYEIAEMASSANPIYITTGLCLPMGAYEMSPRVYARTHNESFYFMDGEDGRRGPEFVVYRTAGGAKLTDLGSFFGFLAQPEPELSKNTV